MTKKISELTPGEVPDGTELLEAVQGGASVSLTAQQIANLGGDGGGVMPGSGYAARLCALLEPDAIEALQKGAFSYSVAAQTKYVLASWKTQLGGAGRAEVRNPQVPMPLQNITFSGTGSDSAAILLDPSVPTYADAWTTYFARKLAIDSLPTRTIPAPAASQRKPFLPGPYGAIITQVTVFDHTWLVLRVHGSYGVNLSNEISDANVQRVGNGLALPISKRVGGAIEGGPISVAGQSGSVSFVLLPSDWSAVADPVAASYDWRDDFMEAALSATDWTIGTVGTGKVEIDTTYQWCKLFGTGNWDGNALLRKSAQTRAEGKAFVCDCYLPSDAGLGWASIGWSNGGATTGYSATNFAHCINFSGSGIINVYEDGTNRGTVGSGWTANTIYRLRITLHVDGSAKYEIQGGATYPAIGAATWTNITPTTSTSTKTTVYAGAAAYAGSGYISDPRVY